MMRHILYNNVNWIVKVLITLFTVLYSLFTNIGASAQGIPFIRNFSAEEYHANSLNYDVETDEKGNVFIANFEGLMYYDHADWRIIHTPGISRVTVCVRTSDNTIWVGGYNYFGKVMHKANGELYLKRIAKPDLFRGEVSEIYEMDGKVRFIVNNGNIYQVDGEDASIWKTANSKSLQIGMLDVVDVDAVIRGDKDVVKSDIITEESLDNGYTAAIKKGVGLIIRNNKGEDLYTLSDTNGLCSNEIVYLSYDHRGQLWGATAKGVFSVQVPSAYTCFTSYEGLSGSVLSIETFHDKIYVGTDDGLFRQEGMRFVRVADIRFACWDMQKNDKDLLAATADGIYRIYPDGKAAHLTATTCLSLICDGAHIYCGETNGIYQIQVNGQGRKLVCSLDNVRKLRKDAEGTIWAQSLYGSIWYKKTSSEVFELYKTSKKEETMQTIVPVGRKVEIISADTTQPFPYPLYAFEDEKGVTWLTNNEGKSLYRWKDGKQLHDLDLLLSPVQETAIRAMFIREHEIWLGTDNGLTIINTQEKGPAFDKKPVLYIRSITLAGDSILWGGFGTAPQMLPELSHNDNDLRFTFSIDYTPVNGKTLYRYRLNNGSWSAWSEETYASLTNIQSGNYTFSVQAKDALNRITDITSIKFHINPPFYYRWYMNLLYLLMLMTLFYMLFRLRLRKLEKDKIRLENVIQERTAEVVKQKDEIEEKSKSLEKALDDLNTAQHELIRQEKMATVGKLTQGLIDRILNPLNYINNFSKLSEGLVKDVQANVEDDQDKMDKDNYEDTMDVLNMLSGNLQKVSEHGQNTTRTLKAMEEMLKDRSGGIISTDLVVILRQDKEMLETYYANDIAEHHIQISFEVADKEIPIQANPEQLNKSLMSVYANAIYALVKKAQRTAYEPELTTKVTVAGQTITLVIRDNGIGIEDTIINKIFDPFFTTKTTGEAAGVGLYLTHEVIQNYGGNISVKSVKDEFCEFTITLPTIKK